MSELKSSNYTGYGEEISCALIIVGFLLLALVVKTTTDYKGDLFIKMANVA